ncbi:hypothetical protein KM043_009871 [Ampulex compressa]|nr:hypothetical protein KM043_009871 [Ampulex compressa]
MSSAGPSLENREEACNIGSNRSARVLEKIEKKKPTSFAGLSSSWVLIDSGGENSRNGRRKGYGYSPPRIGRLLPVEPWYRAYLNTACIIRLEVNCATSIRRFYLPRMVYGISIPICVLTKKTVLQRLP